MCSTCSFTAFLSFALPCLLPSVGYLLLSDHPLQQGWGVLGSILLLALLVVAWQVNRLVQRSLLQRFHNQALISNLEHAKLQAEGLNGELAHEVEQRRRLVAVEVLAGPLPGGYRVLLDVAPGVTPGP